MRRRLALPPYGPGTTVHPSRVGRRAVSKHHVRNRASDHKRLTHPVIGELELDFDALLVPGQGQRVIV